ncbi:MAG TPA: coniferyl-alcohol dehydrogenase [Sphingobium sp.]
MSYKDKSVVVTGCASGIGAAVSRALLAEGAHVIGLDRQTGAHDGLAARIAVDLGDPESIDAAASRIAGPVDALFHCAGLSPTQPLLAVIRVNFLGLRHLTQALLPVMRDGGAIASISSNGGLNWRSRKDWIVDFLETADFAEGLEWVERHRDGIENGYRFAKEALTVWTMRESARLIRRGIRINCTSPGAVQTPMLSEIEEKVSAAAIDVTTDPIGRRSPPEEQAAPLLFLNSDAASYINGVDLPVDGGFAARVALGTVGKG